MLIYLHTIFETYFLLQSKSPIACKGKYHIKTYDSNIQPVRVSGIKNGSSLKYFITEFEYDRMYYSWFAVKYRLLDFILKCFCLVSNLLQGFSYYIELEFMVCSFTLKIKD